MSTTNEREYVVDAPNGKFSVGDFISYEVLDVPFKGLDIDFVGRVMGILRGGAQEDTMQIQVFRYRPSTEKRWVNEYYETTEIVECPLAGYRVNALMLHVDCDDGNLKALAMDTFGQAAVAMGEVGIYKHELVDMHLLQTIPTDRTKLWSRMNKQPENDVHHCCVPAAPTSLSYHWMIFDPEVEGEDAVQDYVLRFYKVNVFDLYCSPLSRSCRRSGRDKNPRQWAHVANMEVPPEDLHDREPMRMPATKYLLEDVMAIRNMARDGATPGMFFTWVLQTIDVAEARLEKHGGSAEAGLAEEEEEEEGQGDDMSDFIVGGGYDDDDTDFDGREETVDEGGEILVDEEEEEEYVDSCTSESEEESPWAHSPMYDSDD